MLQDQAIVPGFDEGLGEEAGLGFAGLLAGRIPFGSNRRIFQGDFSTDDAAVITGEGLSQPDVLPEVDTNAGGCKSGRRRATDLELSEIGSGAMIRRDSDHPLILRHVFVARKSTKIAAEFAVRVESGTSRRVERINSAEG